MSGPEIDAVVQVRKYLNKAVERQLVADVPVGAFLSGGLDSSSIVAIAQRRMWDRRLQCFTIGFRDPRALAEGKEEFEVELEGRAFRQQPQKYHAKSLKVLRERYAAVSDRSALDPILEETGCRAWLT